MQAQMLTADLTPEQRDHIAAEEARVTTQRAQAKAAFVVAVDLARRDLTYRECVRILQSRPHVER